MVLSKEVLDHFIIVKIEYVDTKACRKKTVLSILKLRFTSSEQMININYLKKNYIFICYSLTCLYFCTDVKFNNTLNLIFYGKEMGMPSMWLCT